MKYLYPIFRLSKCSHFYEYLSDVTFRYALGNVMGHKIILQCRKCGDIVLRSTI